MKIITTLVILSSLLPGSCVQHKKGNYQIHKTDAEWKKQLTRYNMK